MTISNHLFDPLFIENSIAYLLDLQINKNPVSDTLAVYRLFERAEAAQLAGILPGFS